MDKKKRKLANLVDAVSAILGKDPPAAGKLKKAKALERFIGKLEDRRRDIAVEVDHARKKGREATKRSRQVEKLDKQIKKANKILASMK